MARENVGFTCAMLVMALVRMLDSLEIGWNCTYRDLQNANLYRYPRWTRTLLKRGLSTVSSLLFCFVISGGSVCSQPKQTSLTLLVSGNGSVRVKIDAATPARSWSFLNSYAGILGLADRVEDFQAKDSADELVSVRKVAAGEYRADKEVTRIDYRVRLPIQGSIDAAHVSWLTQQNGLLMLADLLPRDLVSGQSVEVELIPPPTWQTVASVTKNRNDGYAVSDSEKAVFFVGESLRTSSKSIEGTPFQFGVAGDWPFKDEQTVKAAARVLKKYFDLTGFRLPKTSTVIIAPTPNSSGAMWSAGARGSAVVILLNPRANFRNWISQLEIIFTHELFHLWVPNSLRLAGDYDWFFEGFTLYQGLLTARELKLISFRGYLDTLARVYDSYCSNVDNLSLVEASERRWSSASPAVYDKGMLVAFLYDLITREQSGGNSGLSETYRTLFTRHADKSIDANEAIMSLLTSSPATGDILKTYVLGRGQLELEATLKRYGLVVDSSQSQTHLKVAENLSQNQLRLLRSLGYKQK